MKKYMSFKVWILVAAIVLALFTIAPNPWATGLQVKTVDTASDAAQNGLAVGDILYSINDIEVFTEEDVFNILESL